MREWNYPTTVTLKYGDPLPSPMCDRTIYVHLNDDREIEIASFVCPCGCGEAYDLGIRPARKAPGYSWECVIDDNNRVTLTPSINHMSGCMSHFHIEHGMARRA